MPMFLYLYSVLGFAAHSWCTTAPRLYISCRCCFRSCSCPEPSHKCVKCKLLCFPHICTNTEIFTVIIFILKYLSCFIFPGIMLVLSAWCLSLLAGMAMCDRLWDSVAVFDIPSSSTGLPNVSKILFIFLVYHSPKCHPLMVILWQPLVNSLFWVL